MARCEDFIEVGKEKHHFKTLNRQKDKFNRLLQQKHIEEDKCKGLHGIHIVYHSNASIQNNTNPIHVENRENNNHNNNNYNNCVQDDEREDTERKENIWVKNLSSTPLTKDQIKALAHRPNYAIVPRNPPLGEYIMAIENACNQLPQGKVEELRGGIKSVLKKIHPPRSNITREERKAIDELRRDNTKMILTTDKGVSMVVMNRDDYHQKAEALLQETTYQPIPNDPTNN